MLVMINKIMRYITNVEKEEAGYIIKFANDRHNDIDFICDTQIYLDSNRVIELYFTKATVAYLIDIANFINNNKTIFARVNGNIPTVLAENIRVYLSAKYNLVLGIDAEED